MKLHAAGGALGSVVSFLFLVGRCMKGEGFRSRWQFLSKTFGGGGGRYRRGQGDAGILSGRSVYGV